jgi:hypothetical protein
VRVSIIRTKESPWMEEEELLGCQTNAMRRPAKTAAWWIGWSFLHRAIYLHHVEYDIESNQAFHQRELIRVTFPRCPPSTSATSCLQRRDSNLKWEVKCKNLNEAKFGSDTRLKRIQSIDLFFALKKDTLEKAANSQRIYCFCTIWLGNLPYLMRKCTLWGQI